MYCPNCGKENSAEQNFCRSCGLSLEKAAQSLSEQLPTAKLDKHLQGRRRRVERLLIILGGSAVLVFVISIVWAIIVEIIIGKGHVLGGVIFLGFILGAILAALLVIYRESLYKASSKPLLPRMAPRSEPTARQLPESYIEPIPSVTERTTELLVAEKKSSARES